MIRLYLIFPVLFLFNLLQAQVPKRLTEPFEYKKSFPFSYHLKETNKSKSSLVQEISINNDKLQKINAYLIIPKTEGKYPVVIFQHGGDHDNTQFLQEAKELSKKGIICMLIEAPWLRPIYQNKNQWANTAQFYRQGIIDIQRSIDFLGTQPYVDTSNIAFAGHSYGAQIGGILSGIEPRIKAFVLMSGTSSFTDLLRVTDHAHTTHVRDSIPIDFNKWLDQMEPLNPIHYVKYARSPFFFQFATNDEYDIDEIEAKKYVAASPKTDHVSFYKSGHNLKNKKAEEDRFKWLIQKLKPDENQK